MAQSTCLFPRSRRSRRRDYLAAAQSMFDPQQWTDSFTRLQRAMRLSVSLGRKQDPFLAISDAALGMLRRIAPTDPLYFSLRAIELLLEHRVGEPSELPELAMQVAYQSEAGGDLHRACSYLERAESCWKRVKAHDRVEACVRQRARLLEREAVSWAKSDDGAMQADGLIEQAIKAYQSIAGTSHEVVRLKAELQRVRAVAVKHFKQIDRGAIDLTEQAEKASSMVRGKRASEALIALASLACPTPLQRLRQAAVATLASSPLLAMIRREELSHSGRVIHRRPGIEEGDGVARRARTTRSGHARTPAPPWRNRCDGGAHHESDRAGLLRVSIICTADAGRCKAGTKSLDDRHVEPSREDHSTAAESRPARVVGLQPFALGDGQTAQSAVVRQFVDDERWGAVRAVGRWWRR
jgi:hypothetical protein